MAEILKELQCDWPVRDFFATPQNTRCVEYIGEEDDAMHQAWGGGLNCCNPLLSILDQVVTKIEAERPEIVVVARRLVRKAAKHGESTGVSNRRDANF